MSHIFISYSRKDVDFAQKIVDALAENDLDTWIDWKSIPKGEKWLDEIYRGIEEADAFLFLVSPDSVISEYCIKEIDHAAKNGKRILPIVICDADPKVIHPEISKRNWIFCRGGQDDFEKAIEEIRMTIHTDYEWLRYHTELQVKALKWDQKKDNSRLLRGKELREAEQQFAEISNQKDPQPTKLQREYILTSQKNEIRQRSQLTISLGTGLVVVAALAIFAWGQRNSALASEATAIAEANSRATAESNAISEANAKATALVNEENARATAQAEKERAEKQAEIALARQLAAVSQLDIFRSSKSPLISTLLAIESYQRLPSQEAEQSLRQALAIMPIPLINLTHSSDVTAFAISPDEKRIVTSERNDTVNMWDIEKREIIFQKQQDSVYALAFSPNGQRVFTANSNTINIWNSSDGKETQQIPVERPQNVILFSPDSRRLLLAQMTGLVQVIDIRTGREVSRRQHRVDPEWYWFMVAAFSPDGSRIISGGKDNAAIIWDVETGVEIARMRHSWTVYAVAFSPNGELAASASGSQAIIWEASTGKEVSRFTHDDIISSLQFSSDGKWIVANESCNICNTRSMSVRVWDVETGSQVSQMIHEDHIDAASFSPDGKWILSTGRDNTVSVWEAATARETSRLIHDDSAPIINNVGSFSALFSPSGRWVASMGVDEQLRIWTFQQYPELSRLKHAEAVNIVTFSPNGKLIATGDYIVHVWNAITGEEIFQKRFNHKIRSIVFSPDGRLLAAGGFGDYFVHVWNLENGQEIARMKHDYVVNSIDFSPDGTRLVTSSHDFTARIWDIASATELLRLTHNDIVTEAEFSPDGKKVVTNESCESTCVSEIHQARLWDAETGKLLAGVNEGKAWVENVMFAPDGNLFTSSDWDGLRVWDSATGRSFRNFPQEDGITDVTFSHDGSRIATAGDKGALRIWDLRSGKLLSQFSHDEWVPDIEFSYDDKYLLSGSYDKSLRVWDVATGKQLAYMLSDAAINTVAFSPDGKFAAAGSDDRTVRIWMWKIDDLILEACSRVPRNLTSLEWKQYVGESVPYDATCPNLPVQTE